MYFFVLNFGKLIFFITRGFVQTLMNTEEYLLLYSTPHDPLHHFWNHHLKSCSIAQHTGLRGRDAGDPEDLNAA